MYCKQHGKSAKYIQQKGIYALLHLMETYSFEEITITQICQEAQISRASFYRNFDSKENALLYWTEQIIQKYRQDTEDSLYRLQQAKELPTVAIQQLCEQLFQFVSDNKKYFQQLQKNNLFYMFRQIGMCPNDDSFYFRHLCSVYDFPHLHQYLCNCIIGVQYALLDQWLTNDCAEDPKQMGQLMTKLFCNINPGWIDCFQNQIYTTN